MINRITSLNTDMYSVLLTGVWLDYNVNIASEQLGDNMKTNVCRNTVYIFFYRK